jgi:arginase
MNPIAIVDAPSVLGLFPRGVEYLPESLHAHDLMTAVGAVEHTTLLPPASTPEPDVVTGVNNTSAIVAFTQTLADTVGDALDRGRFPLVLGGDCTIVFGPLLSLARRGRSGLLFLDGHADFSHPDDEPSGEGASMDLAIATGYCADRFPPIGGFEPLIDPERVAVLGYRVHGDGTDNNRGRFVADTRISAIDLDDLRARGLRRAVDDSLAVLTASDVDGFWVHIDVDVLDDDVMPAVDYRNPDGLSWEELTTIVRASIATGHARGLDLSIFNPSLDVERTLAARIVRFLGEALA